MVHYFVFNFYAREDGVFLPSFYYNELFHVIRNLLSTELFTITHVRTKNKKEVEDGVWVFENFRIYLATPFVELITQNILKIYEVLNSLFEGIYLKNISYRKMEAKSKGILISGAYAQKKDGICIEYEKQPELFSETLRKQLLDIYYSRFGKHPEDQRFFFIITENLKRQHVIDNRVEYFGRFEIFASKELLEMFCQMFCVK
ncbi:hypothetical protein [Anaerocellum danielii]|uniref:CCZ1/INTU/HSP4 first Longin domain-containing protein n=1 Tax=Anaerocellum danielii TaxID=1387557 RepID=A0ABZ0U0C8_9FIRM|nr:hypothetical protein [Caldicellulosiruptor danielii]WPX08761.1 hypothetical protein SOJ16_002671 [Caldicellulosiruptor danielii]